MEDEKTRQIRCYNFFSDSLIWGGGGGNLEPRTSDRVLVLGGFFFPERTRYSNLIGGFLEELKIVLVLVE
jgi:hypothetical protein